MHQKQSSLYFVKYLKLSIQLIKKLKKGNCCIHKSESIKYLGVSLDSALTYQEEVKSILRKMACGEKNPIFLTRGNIR